MSQIKSTDDLPDATRPVRRSSRLQSKTTATESKPSTVSRQSYIADFPNTNGTAMIIVDELVSSTESSINVAVELGGVVHVQNNGCTEKASQLTGVNNNLESVDEKTHVEYSIVEAIPTQDKTVEEDEKMNIPPREKNFDEEHKNYFPAQIQMNTPNVEISSASKINHLKSVREEMEETENISTKEQIINNSDAHTVLHEDTLKKEVAKLYLENNSLVNVNSVEITPTEMTIVDNKVGEEQTIDKENLLGEKTEIPTTSENVHEVVKNNEIDSKIDEIICNMLCSSDSDDEPHQNSFIDTMAEEGEEDTPSEGSNDIVEVGEHINSTESELSTDESYENNSFIDNDDNYQLLSGEEYDLSIDDDRKRSRIIQLSSGSDVSIVHVKTIKKNKIKKKKKSRIIRFGSSSDEEPTDVVIQNGLLKEKKDISNETANHNCDSDIGRNYCGNDEVNITNLHYFKEATNESKINRTENEITEQFVHSHHNNNVANKENTENNSLNHTLTSPIFHKVQNLEHPNKKIIILENIKVHNICFKGLGDHVSTAVNSFCSENNVGVSKSSGNFECCDEEHFNGNLVKRQVTSPQATVTSTARDTTEIIHNNSESILETSTRKNKKSEIKQTHDTEKFNLYPKSLQFNSKSSTNLCNSIYSNDIKFEVDNGKSNDYFNDRKTTKKRKYRNYTEGNEWMAKKQKMNGEVPEEEDTSLLKLNIFDEAICHDKKTQVCLTSDLLNEKSNVANKRFHKTGSLDHKPKPKNTIDTKFKAKQFHVKDFRSLMLYDSTRNKRMETKKLLQKKV